MRLFEPQRTGMKHEVRPQQGARSRDERSRAKLRERVLSAVWRDDVVPGLRTAMISDHEIGLAVTHQKIDRGPFPSVSEPQIKDDPGLAGHRSNPLARSPFGTL